MLQSGRLALSFKRLAKGVSIGLEDLSVAERKVFLLLKTYNVSNNFIQKMKKKKLQQEV